MSKKASVVELNGLHDRLASYFVSLLESNERLAPGELSAIAKFLKDNEITASATESNPMQNLITKFLANEELYEEVG